MKIGIISDTHSLLRNEVRDRLRGCDMILHAGDVCDQWVLDELAQIAPVHAARGNNDWSLMHLPVNNVVEVNGRKILITHIKSRILEDTSVYDMVVYGHTHRYAESQDGNTLFLNPGSCGPRHFTQPITMALVDLDDDGFHVTKVEIPHDEPAR